MTLYHSFKCRIGKGHSIMLDFKKVNMGLWAGRFQSTRNYSQNTTGRMDMLTWL
jgi:hypothetical protein